MHKNKRKYGQLIFAILGLVLIILIAMPLFRNIQKRYVINKEINEIKSEIDRLNGKNNKLNELVKYLESDSFVEEKARLNLNMKQVDESVLQIKTIDGEQLVQAASGTESGTHYDIPGLDRSKTAVRVKQNYRLWWQYFFK